MWSTLNGLFGCIIDVGRVNIFCASRVFHNAPLAIPTTQSDCLSDNLYAGDSFHQTLCFSPAAGDGAGQGK